MEIVTEPDIRTAEQARRYAEELQLLLRSIGASDADMERGQMRVEANVSLRPRGTEPFGTRVEVKNMNSFRAVERAIAFEIERQAAALDAGEPLVQETRGWSEERGETYRMRVKETSDDYRYFPEPDLPPLHVDAAWLAEIRAGAAGAAGGAARRATGTRSGCRRTTRRSSSPTRTRAALFEATLAADPALDAKPVANWVTGEYLRPAQRGRPAPVAVAPAELAAIVAAVDGGSISRAQGREVLEAHAATGETAAAIIAARGFRQISDAGALAPAVDEVLAANPAAVADYRAGKAQAVGVPRRPGHEGDPRPGERRAGPGDAVRAALEADRRRRAERVGLVEHRAVGRPGSSLIAVGYTRARGPWARYQALKAQDANVARYEAWRGGVRDDGTTGASVAMAVLRRQAQIGAGDRDRRRRARLPRASSIQLTPPARAGAAAPSRPRDPPPLDRRAAVHHDLEARRRGRSAAASQLTTPSWSHRQRAPAATASRACGTHSSERRKTSTMSNGPVAATASASVGKARHARGPRARSG